MAEYEISQAESDGRTVAIIRGDIETKKEWITVDADMLINPEDNA